jgi:hypothetical protein
METPHTYAAVMEFVETMGGRPTSPDERLCPLERLVFGNESGRWEVAKEYQPNVSQPGGLARPSEVWRHVDRETLVAWIRNADESAVSACAYDVFDRRSPQARYLLEGLVHRYGEVLTRQAGALSGRYDVALGLVVHAFARWVTVGLGMNRSQGRSKVGVLTELRKQMVEDFRMSVGREPTRHQELHRLTASKPRIYVSSAYRGHLHALQYSTGGLDRQFELFRRDYPLHAAVLLWISQDQMSFDEVARSLGHSHVQARSFISEARKRCNAYVFEGGSSDGAFRLGFLSHRPQDFGEWFGLLARRPVPSVSAITRQEIEVLRQLLGRAASRGASAQQGEATAAKDAEQLIKKVFDDSSLAMMDFNG